MTISSIIAQTTVIVKPTFAQASALRAAHVKVAPLHNGTVAMMWTCPSCRRFQRINCPITGNDAPRHIARSIELATATDCVDCRVSLVAPVTRSSGRGGGSVSRRKARQTVTVTRTQRTPKWMLRQAELQAKADAFGIAALTPAEVRKLGELTAKLYSQR